MLKDLEKAQKYKLIGTYREILWTASGAKGQKYIHSFLKCQEMAVYFSFNLAWKRYAWERNPAFAQTRGRCVLA